MRHLGFITAGLTLALSVVIEVSFFVVFRFFTNGSFTDSPTTLLNRAFVWFHSPARFLGDCIESVDTGSHWRIIVGTLIFFAVAVLEWWFIFLAATWFIRYMRRKSV
jgi:F0F1-type ATP synthase assembly protein I